MIQQTLMGKLIIHHGIPFIDQQSSEQDSRLIAEFMRPHLYAPGWHWKKGLIRSPEDLADSGQRRKK